MTLLCSAGAKAWEFGQPAHCIAGNNGGGVSLNPPASKPVPFLLAIYLLLFSFSKVLGQKASINNARITRTHGAGIKKGFAIVWKTIL